MRARLMLCFLAAGACAAQDQATVSGVVLDASTRLPIEGALVSAAGGRSIRTDGEGRYSLAVNRASGGQVKAAKTGYVPSQVDPGAAASLSIDFQLKPLLRISGTVEDYDTGRPITGAHVFALRSVFAMGRVWPVAAGLLTADTRNGQFQIRNLETGSYVLEIDIEGKFHGWRFYPDVPPLDMATLITLSEAADTQVRIRLHPYPLRSVTGVVSAPSRIELTREVGANIVQVTSQTVSSAGPFHVDNLPEGDYRITAKAFDGSFAEAPVSIADHDISDIQLNPQPVLPISGVVRMADGSLALPQGRRVVSGEKQVRVIDGKFEIAPTPGLRGLRLAGLPDGYAIGSVEQSPQLTYTITTMTGTLLGNIGDRVAVLFPAMRVLTGDFQVTLAPGSYTTVVLDGDEKLLANLRPFIEAKAAAEGQQVEIKSGETTVLAAP